MKWSSLMAVLHKRLHEEETEELALEQRLHGLETANWVVGANRCGLLSEGIYLQGLAKIKKIHF
jgi:hypothetical protein